MAVAAAVAILLLTRPPVAAPGPDGDPGESPSGWAIDPAPAPDPWAAVDWQRLDDPFAPHQPPLLRVDAMTHGPAGLIGWGRVPTLGRNEFNDMAAVFLSPNGREWRIVPMEDGVNAPSTSELTGVAVGPRGHLAFGGVCCRPGGPAMWHSADGETWTRIDVGGDLGQMGAYVNDAVGTTDGWVAMGGGPDGSSGHIWASADGVSWESVLTVENGAPGLTITDLAASPDGVIAVGTVTAEDGTYDGAIWRSADGWSWERVAADEATLIADGETRLEKVVPFAGGIFIAGANGSTEDRVRCEQLGALGAPPSRPPGPTTSCGWGAAYHWISVDGEAWRRIDPAIGDAEYPIEFRHVVAGGPGIVVLGESSAVASPDTTLFTSRDGIAWTALRPAPMREGIALGLVVSGRQLLAVTDHWDGTRSNLIVWLGSAR